MSSRCNCLHFFINYFLPAAALRATKFAIPRHATANSAAFSMCAVAFAGVYKNGARGAGLPVQVAPFANRCFDAEKVDGERCDPRLPRAAVALLPQGGFARQLVVVSLEGDNLVVEVTSRAQNGRLIGLERRTMIAAGECGALIDPALVVVRAVTPGSSNRCIRRPCCRRQCTAAPNVGANARAAFG